MYHASASPDTRLQGRKLSRGWRIFARVFVGINIAGFIFAMRDGEGAHAAGHLVLLFMGITAYLVWRYAGSIASTPDPVQVIDPANEVLDRLQQSVDKIALEVERVGESQRYHAKVLEKRING